MAVACNLINNLPAGLIAGSALTAAHAPTPVASAVLIGVDLGPNFSVTGSLATILWLTALRRDGIEVTAGSFLRLGVVVTIPALALALACVALTATT
jgi:arsenical pump membrane protein